MAMLKGLRKHNKWILVVGGSLLMIAWLMPQGIKQLGPSRSGPVQGTLDGRKVRSVEFSQYSAELQVVRALIPTIMDNLLGSGERNQSETAHWLLLTQEAEDAGFVGGPQDGADWLQEIAPSFAYQAMFEQARSQFPQLSEQLFQQFILPGKQKELQQQIDQLRDYFAGVGLQRAAGSVRMTTDEALQAVAKAKGVYRMEMAYVSAPRASDRLALARAKKWGDRATTDVVFIPSDLLLAGVADPTDEELAAHFEKYRETIPGTGQFGVGYRLPQRIKLEYLKLDRAAIRQAIAVDPVDAYKEWQLNRDKFKGEFAAEKTKVEDSIRDRRADEVIQAAIQIIRAEVFKTIKRLDQDGKYRKIPDGWDASRPRLEDVAQAVQAQVADTTGVKIPLPTVVVKAAKWQNLSDLAADPDLAGARIQYASRELPLTQSAGRGLPPVIFQLRELGVDSPLLLQTGIPAVEYPATDAARNVYFYTVLDARNESPADSLDEVRDEAISDFKKIKAYDTLATRVDEFRNLAVAGGPSAVVDTFRDPNADPTKEPPKLPTVSRDVSMSRVSVQGDPQIDTEAFREALMGAAEKIDPLAEPTTYDAAAATVVAPIPEHLGVAVARITAVHPLTWEMYRQGIEKPLADDIQREVRQASATWPFTYAAAAARHGWVPKVSEEDEEAGTTPAAPAGGQTPPSKG